LAVFSIALCRNLLKTAHGLQFLAVREDEIASLAMGVNIKRTKIAAFVIGSALAGAAGAILAHGEGFINNQTFGMDVSFIILTMVVLGGTGSITGSVIAAIALFALPEVLRSLVDSNGDPIKVTAAWFVALFVAAVATIAILKRLTDHYHGPKMKKTLFGIGTVIGAIVLQWLLTKGFSQIPSLVTADKTYEIGTLRMVLFAGTLVFAMLLKPKGIMGHREFTVGNLGGLLGPKRESPGVEH
jgi:branched-chain amino acid transport system permease protein